MKLKESSGAEKLYGIFFIWKQNFSPVSILKPTTFFPSAIGNATMGGSLIGT